MRGDISEQVRIYAEYVDSMVEEWTVDEMIAVREERQTSRPTSVWWRNPVVVGATAFLAVVIAMSPAILFRGGNEPMVGDQPTSIPTAPPLPTTVPPPTTEPAPSTTQPPSRAEPKSVAGQWTMYGAEEGLPAAGEALAVDPDGVAWAMTNDHQLYRLDETQTQWSPIGSRLEADYWAWFVATPNDGVALALPEDAIVMLDGNEWTDTGVTAWISAVVTGGTQTRVLGYDENDNLIDIRFVDGSVEVRTASRGVNAGSGPSFLSVPWTVDIDSQGNAWYGTVEGPWRFDGETAELIDLGERGGCCAPLAVDANDNVWINIDTGTLFRITPSGRVTRFTAADGIHFSLRSRLRIVPTADGTVWLLQRGENGIGGEVAHFDGSEWNSYTGVEALDAGLPTWRMSLYVFDGPDGSTWTIDNNPGLVLHRFLNGEWRTVPTPGTLLFSPADADWGSRGAAVGPDGSLWIPTSTGVARFQPSGD